MHREIKEKVRREYLERVKLVARSMLYGGNLIKAINVWAVVGGVSGEMQCRHFGVIES